MSAPHEDFSGRLQMALDRAAFASGRARTGALAARYAVTRETARKWLSGLALPELARLIELATDFHVGVEWLATGRGEIEAPKITYPLTSPSARAKNHVRESNEEDRLLEVYRQMPEAKRRLLVDFLSF